MSGLRDININSWSFYGENFSQSGLLLIVNDCFKLLQSPLIIFFTSLNLYNHIFLFYKLILVVKKLTILNNFETNKQNKTKEK